MIFYKFLIQELKIWTILNQNFAIIKPNDEKQ